MWREKTLFSGPYMRKQIKQPAFRAFPLLPNDKMITYTWRHFRRQ